MKKVLCAALFGALTTTTTWAQTPPTPATPASPARAAAGARQAAPPAPTVAVTPISPAVAAPRAYPNPPRNVRFEIVITETGIAKPSTKTVSLTVNDGGGSGSVRNGAPNTASLNVDVRGVQAFEGGAVRAAIGVEYQPWDTSTQLSSIQSSITSMFQDGRRMQILQTADPLSDRRTTIDVTMTVLK